MIGSLPPPKCVKCGSLQFALSNRFRPEGSDSDVFAIQCAQCGGVVGVEGEFAICEMLLEQNRAIQAIANALKIPVTLTIR